MILLVACFGNEQLTVTSTCSTIAVETVGKQSEVYFTLPCPPTTGIISIITLIMVFTASKY